MRINYTMDYLEAYGGIRTTNIIANKLVERGHEVTVTLMEPQPLLFDWKAQIIFAEDINKTIRRKLSNLINRELKAFPFPGVYAIIDSLTQVTPNCDINVAQTWLTVYPVYRSKKGLPFHHLQHFEEIFFNGRPEKQFFDEGMYLPVHRTVNSIWCQNQVKQRYGYCLPIINPGIDHSIFYPRNVERDRSKKRILCLGKDFVIWKGFLEAVESVKLVMQKRNDIEFLAYGAKPLRGHYDVPIKFIENPSNEELAILYSSVDVLICPSWYESFPGPPIEAMACGTPVVTTKYGTEDYAQHEENSLVVMPKDIKGMADAILRLLSDSDLKEKFREKGPQTAKCFTWDKTVDKFEKLFHMALEERKPSFEDTKIHLTQPVPKGFDENVQLVVKK